jgi:hypothetical protein
MEKTSTFIEKQKRARLILQISGVSFLIIYFISKFNHVLDSHIFVRQFLLCAYGIVSLFISFRYKLLNIKITLIYALIALGLLLYQMYLR